MSELKIKQGIQTGARLLLDEQEIASDQEVVLGQFELVDGELVPATGDGSLIDADTLDGIEPSANGLAILGAADYAAMRDALDLVPGTDVLAFTGSVKRGSIAPTEPFSLGISGVNWWAQFAIPSGGAAGTADDYQLVLANALPHRNYVVDSFFKVTTAAGGSTAEIRSESGGGGVQYTLMATAATGVNRNTSQENYEADIVTPLYLRRSDRSVVGTLYVQFFRNT
jgi:hypothetical protein